MKEELSGNYHLCLGDGSRWILSFDADCRSWGERFAGIMKLEEAKTNGFRPICFRRISPKSNGTPFPWNADRTQARANPFFNDRTSRLWCYEDRPDILCEMEPCDDDESVGVINMWNALTPVYLECIGRGGLPFHAALVEKDGYGCLLAAPGGTGKSTCAGRIGEPWKALCDDESLIVASEENHYRAHPFPTWSDYLWKRGEPTWNVQYSVPLAALFFLERSEKDEAEPLGQANTAVRINESSVQICRRFLLRMNKHQQRHLKTALFANACRLARTLPAYRLGVSLKGKFWKEMEKVVRM